MSNDISKRGLLFAGLSAFTIATVAGLAIGLIESDNNDLLKTDITDADKEISERISILDNSPTIVFSSAAQCEDLGYGNDACEATIQEVQTLADESTFPERCVDTPKISEKPTSNYTPIANPFSYNFQPYSPISRSDDKGTIISDKCPTANIAAIQADTNLGNAVPLFSAAIGDKTFIRTDREQVSVNKDGSIEVGDNYDEQLSM